MALQQMRSVDDSVAWLRGSGVRGSLCGDHRRLHAGDAFMAWPGGRSDARAFVRDALSAGAAACLVEAEGVDAFAFDDARIAALPGLKTQAGPLASRWYGEPSRRLQVVAVTGTNGKTSSACWVAEALTALGRRCGIVGTLGIGMPGALHDSGLTTPDALMLQAAFAGFVADGAAACAIEASSIGLAEHRIDGTAIAVAVFTNLTQDHLDYHGSMAAYWAAKRQLFDWPGLQAAVVNVDDDAGRVLAEELAATSLPLCTVALHAKATLQACAPRYADGGLCFDVREGDATIEVRSALIGEHNVHNMLGVIGALRMLGVSLRDAAACMQRLAPVVGRLEQVNPGAAGEPLVVVDYAHTPDALDKALRALRPLARARTGRLWCVFGCGGDRDAGKRPLMGAIAARDADAVVITSDNPRSESPAQILAQILVGVARSDAVDVIEDRAAAIGDAIARAAPADVVLLAGKGHETYQEVAGVRLAFSDMGVARESLARRAGAQPQGAGA